MVQRFLYLAEKENSICRGSRCFNGSNTGIDGLDCCRRIPAGPGSIIAVSIYIPMAGSALLAADASIQRRLQESRHPGGFGCFCAAPDPHRYFCLACSILICITAVASFRGLYNYL